MKRCGLLVALLAVSLWAFAQAGGRSSSGSGTTSGGAQGTPAAASVGAQPGVNTGVTTSPLTGTQQSGTSFGMTPAGSSAFGTTGFGGVSGSVLNTSTGTAYINAPLSQPLVVTPLIHLGAPAPTAGATNATPGNTAGAVATTLSQIGVPAPLPMVAEIVNPAATVVVNGQALAAPTSQVTSGVTISGTMNPGVSFNTGVGNPFGNGFTVGTYAENQTSLGEIAREFRSRRASEQARTFTNQDIQQLNQSGGISVVGGTAGTAVNTAPATTTQPTGNAPAVAQPGTMNPPANPGVATPVPPAQQSNPPQPPPMSQMQSNTTTEMAQANPPSSMQEMQGSATTGNARSQRGQLPRAASVLPLMALVGFLAAAAGLLAR